MKPGFIINVAGALATTAALVLAARGGSLPDDIVPILAVSLLLAISVNAVLRSRAMHERVRLRAVAARAISKSELQGAQLAVDLGEDAQLLASALLELRAARSDDDPRDARLSGARKAIGTTMQRLEEGASISGYTLLRMLGPEAAIASSARKACDAAGIRLVNELAPVGELSDERQRALVRIARDAVENVAMHAHASELRLASGRTDGAVWLSIQDDGRGFDRRDVRRGPSRDIGLYAMEELAAFCGGTVRFHSRPGQGTRVVIRFPTGDGSVDAQTDQGSARG